MAVLLCGEGVFFQSSDRRRRGLLDNKQGKFEYLAEGVKHYHPRYRASGGPEEFDVDGQVDSGHQQENDDQRDDECPNGKCVG